MEVHEVEAHGRVDLDHGARGEGAVAHQGVDGALRAGPDGLGAEAGAEPRDRGDGVVQVGGGLGALGGESARDRFEEERLVEVDVRVDEGGQDGAAGGVQNGGAACRGTVRGGTASGDAVRGARRCGPADSSSMEDQVGRAAGEARPGDGVEAGHRSPMAGSMNSLVTMSSAAIPSGIVSP
ncbi:hypothetical protein GCM10009853_020710 [Glycomyces scopariae]